MSEWLCPEADNYQGMRVPRALDPNEWQSLADQLDKDNDRSDCFRQRIIDVDVPDANLQQRIQDAALDMSSSLPPALAKLVYQDVLELAGTTCKIVPARELIIKFDLFSDNVCGRWHMDQYVCRSIVSYNCSATQYTADSNVDFNELLYCGKCPDIIYDKSRIQSADVGDIVMMKGGKFPGKAKSLVHKSPDIRYHDNGDTRTRLVLKVDVLNLPNGPGEEFSAFEWE